MLLRTLAFCSLFAAYVHAGKIITYTATSQESQEEANNAAIAGVAKQISAQVKVNQTLNKEEVTSGGESSYNEHYQSNSKVLSDIKVKGVVVKKESATKGFKATATLDLDEFTADIQFKMKSIQMEITKLEEQAREALKNKQFSKAIESIDKTKGLPARYNILVNELGKVYPINDGHRLKQNIDEIKFEIIRELSTIKFDGPRIPFELTSSEIPSFDVKVSNADGFVEGFPLVAKQGRAILSEKTTRENGTVSLSLKNVNIDKGPFIIVIEPNLPEEYVVASNLHKKLEIDFKVKQSRCSINIQCQSEATVCRALEKNLAKKSIFVDSEVKAPILKLSITAKAGKPIEYVPGKYTTPFDIDLSLKGDNISFLSTAHENGKNENDAMTAAVKKMNFSSLKKQLDNYCK